MDEKTCKELLEEYFEGNFKLISFVHRSENSCDINFDCEIYDEDGVNRFVDYYMKETSETIKLKYKKKDKPKSIYNIKAIYRCHHDTRYEGTREVNNLLTQKPFKRFRNTNCPFQMTFKVLKDINTVGLNCNVFIEHNHNHAVSSLEARSFRMLSDEIKMEIETLFSSGFTPSQAYNEFLKNLQSNSDNELQFHLNKADRSKCPRRRDFNSLYIKYCHQIFGGRNGVEMFDKLEERIRYFLECNEGAKISYQLYNKEEDTALILAIVTPLMNRVHSKVAILSFSTLLVFKKFN